MAGRGLGGADELSTIEARRWPERMSCCSAK